MKTGIRHICFFFCFCCFFYQLRYIHFILRPAAWKLHCLYRFYCILPQYISPYLLWNEYRRQQAEWLKGVVNSDEFRAAPVRIVLMHMIPGKEDSWYGEQQIRRLFVPELAGKGIDLMLCGHYHRYQWIDDLSRGADFPILINSNNDKTVVKADEKGIDIRVVDTAGNVLKEHKITKNNR